MTKKIDWIKLEFTEKIIGIIDGITLFEIEYWGKYWEVSSVFLYNIFIQTISIDDKAGEIIYKNFKTLENAKKYCEEKLMKKFYNIFFK